MNKIGFNVLAWSAAVSDELKPIIERLKTIGYDGVEFFVGAPDEKAYKEIGSFTKGLGLESSTVFVMGPDENPIDPDAKIRAKALDKMKWTIDRSHDLGAKIICGPFHSAFSTFAQRSPNEDEYNRSAEVLYQAGEHAKQAGIVLTPEALNRFECYLCNTMDQLLHLITKINHPNVRAMFDTHHANIEEKNLGDAIRKIAPVLGHVHISENDRGTPGSGHVPWDDTFATLAEINYKGWLTIEGFTRNDPDFANSIGVWRDFSEPWEMAENGYKFIKAMGEKHGL
ncbi:sugar phosphate isomerase/epimerase family protein [Cyclobacterium marinum]|uniref:Xylose isomerase domain-containing protein TIM barrel n=1 Tax=Cyclobacterium marinum (strain ATCC 25205 / DSM 745 / LMG 13164 / NCIMB 1802) TaxID=880070 RepID=G0IY42_CYCMS|nr:sugar phosphate isomerase/epimerase family protein [Cyclobacterium marinum]AEL24946.1 Xylose isomerase domain-containing protein TIM barrel [Cyclobacterium marinum DSM 745]MBI0401579.1 sugar phosphate isomerase/epimerase [Cyclobacterium marinum]